MSECQATKKVWSVEKGSGRRISKFVRICGMAAEEGSDLCPRHKFLRGMEVEKQTEKDRQAHLERSVKHSGHGLPKTRAELLARGYQYIGNRECTGCGAAIELWRTPNQRTAPYDPMPQIDSHATSHFATCTKASQFRRAS